MKKTFVFRIKAIIGMGNGSVNTKKVFYDIQEYIWQKKQKGSKNLEERRKKLSFFTDVEMGTLFLESIFYLFIY